MKNNNTRIHRDEMIRFAESPEGRLCWYKSNCTYWNTTSAPAWLNGNTYIVDDVHAELRKRICDLEQEYKVVDWTEEAIGKLCVFADHEDKLMISDYESEVDVLTAIHEKAEFKYAHRSSSWRFCRLLTKEDLDD